MLQRQLISVIVMNFCSLLLTISRVTLALICKNNEMEFAALFQPYDGGKNFEICAQDIISYFLTLTPYYSLQKMYTNS